jgi:hypothetical protein
MKVRGATEGSAYPSFRAVRPLRLAPAFLPKLGHVFQATKRAFAPGISAKAAESFHQKERRRPEPTDDEL